MVAVAPVVTLTARFGATIAETTGSGFIDYELAGGTYTSVTSRVWTVERGADAVTRVLEFSRAGFAALGNIAADTPARVRYTVTVQDADGTTARAFGEVDFTVTAVVQPPNARIDTPAQTIVGGGTLQLEATDSDAGGTIVARRWTAVRVGDAGMADIGGFANAAVRRARWVGPEPQLDTDYALTYTVTDDDGEQASATVIITVQGGVSVEPGTVSTGAPSAALSASPQIEPPTDAEPGTVSTGAPSAALSAETIEDPVDVRMAGTAGAPSAGMTASIVQASGVSVRPGGVALAAPSAAMSAAPSDPFPQDARPGAVATGAPEASLSLTPSEDPVDVRIASSAAAPAASLAVAPFGEVEVDFGNISSAAPSARVEVSIADTFPLEAAPGTVSTAAPSASLWAAPSILPPVDAVFGPVSVAAPMASLAIERVVFNEEFRVAERAEAPAVRVLTAVEFRHPAVADAGRLVNDTEDFVFAGETFLACRFEARLASDEERQAPRAEIAVGNVGRQLSEWVDASGGGAGGTARIFQVVDLPGAMPEWDLTLDIVGINGDTERATVSLGFDPLLGRAAVALRYDPQTAPGLF